MRARRLAIVALGVALVAVVLVVALSGDGDDYEVRLELDNAAGLREGRPVKIGGAEVGKVERLHLGRGDVVQAELALDPETGRIGRGASARIKPTNLLAERFVELDPGDRSHPHPSGAVIPRTRVAASVDLDQVVDVLDADTRVRLGILINEAGLALTGRRADFNAWLEAIPPSLDSLTRLVDELVSDNQTLGRVIAHSERFVGRLATERAELSRMIDSAGETMRTVSARRAQLRGMLERAPRALSTLRRFLADLRVTTQPLAPAARAITSTAPALESTLAELEPFRSAARPALDQAAAVAPRLTQLAVRATPVLRRSRPTLRALTSFARTVAPATEMLHRGTGVNKVIAPGPIDDLLNVIHTWARAIQTRDGLSHVFRGYLVFHNDQMRRLLDLPQLREQTRTRERQRPERSEQRSAGRAPNRTSDRSRELLPRVDRVLPDARDNLPVPELRRGDGRDDPPMNQLLDYLLRP